MTSTDRELQAWRICRPDEDEEVTSPDSLCGKKPPSRYSFSMSDKPSDYLLHEMSLYIKDYISINCMMIKIFRTPSRPGSRLDISNNLSTVRKLNHLKRNFFGLRLVFYHQILIFVYKITLYISNTRSQF